MSYREALHRLLLILQSLLLVFLALHASRAVTALSAAGEDYFRGKGYCHIVVLGDPHLPGKKLTEKGQVIKTINKWKDEEEKPDVDMVAVVGDICDVGGTPEEYKEAGVFFANLKRPLFAIAGNHDYVWDYCMKKNGNPHQVILGNFKEKFPPKSYDGVEVDNFPKPPNLFYSIRMGPYLLIFLSPDELRPVDLEKFENKECNPSWFSLSKLTEPAQRLAEWATGAVESVHSTRMSAVQLEWLKAELNKRDNKERPTIIFFHAPLKDTLDNYDKNFVNKAAAIAQPEGEIKNIIRDNPQIFAWVSGHTHTAPAGEPRGDKSFALLPRNLYEQRVLNIHNADMSRDPIFTNSLYLFPGKVVVETFKHGKKGGWMEKLRRTYDVKKKAWKMGSEG